MTNRRVCKVCGESYNLCFYKPVSEGICDKCGGSLITREDDRLETVSNRLKVYKDQTYPLIEYYKEKGVMVTVNGELPADEVFRDIKKALEKFLDD
jgi:adenylate kinase